jgi:two-component system chemotaxis response regulator CheB
MNQTNVLIVEEDIAYREILEKALGDLKDIIIIGAAPNGKLGLDKTKQKKPDLIVLSSGLNDMSASDFTFKAQAIIPDIGIIILTKSENAQHVIEALEAGAFDFINKPQNNCTEKDREAIQRMLIAKIRCFSIERFSHKAKTVGSKKISDRERTTPETSQDMRIETLNTILPSKTKSKFEAVIIGVSTGGPKALVQLIPAFPPSFPLPIIIVLHMPKPFTRPMAEELNKKSFLNVKEAEDGDVIKAGTAYLAPGGVHLILEKGVGNHVVLKTIDTPPENGCKPSVDVLFRSAAQFFKENVISIILTGMGTDGTKGCAELKKQNAWIIAQDKETSVVWGMPGSAANAGYVDEILPLHKIAEQVRRIAGDA